MGSAKNLVKALVGKLFRYCYTISGHKMKIILMYHRVLENRPNELHDPHMFVSSASFAMHLRELGRHFEFVSLEDLLSCDNPNKSLCSITFDDGWLDNFETALPILQEARLSATIFLPTEEVGVAKRFWFDHLYFLANASVKNQKESDFVDYFNKIANGYVIKNLSVSAILRLTEVLKAKPAAFIYEFIEKAYDQLSIQPPRQSALMNWDQVLIMAQKGILFGSHGLRHDILPKLTIQEKRKAVIESMAILKEKTRFITSIFSYPNGDWDLETIAFLKEAGYKGAVTTRLGYVNNKDRFLLNRVGLSEVNANSRDLIWFQLLRCFYNMVGKTGTFDRWQAEQTD